MRKYVFSKFNTTRVKIIVVQWCHMVSEILVNTGSGTSLLPDNTKPLPDPGVELQSVRSSGIHSQGNVK